MNNTPGALKSKEISRVTIVLRAPRKSLRILHIYTRAHGMEETRVDFPTRKMDTRVLRAVLTLMLIYLRLGTMAFLGAFMENCRRARGVYLRLYCASQCRKFRSSGIAYVRIPAAKFLRFSVISVLRSF